MTRCPHCEHKFLNLAMLSRCPKCKELLKAEPASEAKADEGFDTTGFVLGYATGFPISPMRGISTAAIIGAAMHNSQAAADEPTKSEPSYSGSGGDSGGAGAAASFESSSSSSDSSSSSSSNSSSSSSGGSSE